MEYETYAYDIEILKNLFTAIFINVKDESDIHIFHIGLGKTNWDDLLDFLNQPMVLVGYNNKSYDDPILRFIMTYRGSDILSEINNLSAMLVDNTLRSDNKVLSLRYPRDIERYPWKSVDTMTILAFDKLGVSLKQTAINLKWHKIQDMPIHYTQSVTKEQYDEIIGYNINDVLITKRLYEEITPLRELRRDLSKLYRVDLSSASDSKMANLILEKIYGKTHNMSSIKKLRTRRDKVLLGTCLADFVKFKTPQLQHMLDEISSTYVYEGNRFSYSKKIDFGGCTFVTGIGGLHSEDAPGIFETDEDYIIQDMDVASYYPNLIINNKFYPEHLGKDFIDVLRSITEERIEAKHSGDNVKASGLKITVNSIFGKMGSEYFWLLDYKQLLSTTLSGQMGLLMLIEDLHLNGITVISANTDGVVCKIPRLLEDRYYQVAREWEEKTNLTLEYTLYEKYVRKDVNSYITKKPDGSTKEKGIFYKEINLKKAYRMPIVSRALFEYFINGVPVMDTIASSRDIMDFCISQKAGGKFSFELHTIHGIERLQKTNRFYATTKNGGALLKRNSQTNKTTGLLVGNTVRILNDYNPNDRFEDYNVDTLYYFKEVMKVVNEIEPKQMSLFSLEDFGSSAGALVKSEFETQEILRKKDITLLTGEELATRLKDIVEQDGTIEEISPRYVYVKNVYEDSTRIDGYCLSKGVTKELLLNPVVSSETRVRKNDLLFCDKFSKDDNNADMIDSYCIVNKIIKE